MEKHAQVSTRYRLRARQTRIEDYSYAQKPNSVNQRKVETSADVVKDGVSSSHLGKRKRKTNECSNDINLQPNTKRLDASLDARIAIIYCDSKPQPQTHDSTRIPEQDYLKAKPSCDSPLSTLGSAGHRLDTSKDIIEDTTLDCLRSLLKGFQDVCRTQRHKFTASGALDINLFLLWLAPHWKRGVLTLHTLRKFIGILNLAIRRIDASAPKYEFLVRNGRTTIYNPSRLSLMSRTPTPNDEEEVKHSFGAVLTEKWEEWLAQRQESITNGVDEIAFLEQLPISTLPAEDPETTTGTSQQSVLLKAPQKGSTRTNSLGEEGARPKIATSTEGRNRNLLDRINAKSITKRQSDYPKETLEKDAAVKRIDVILPHLLHRTSDSNRIAQSLSQVIRRIQESAQCPLSVREIEQSLDILAQEIAPDFVKFKNHAGVRCVVLDHSHRPSRVK